jgi:hypothetical protein
MVSPSTGYCSGPRRLSAALVTDPSMAKHELLQGRSVIVVGGRTAAVDYRTADFGVHPPALRCDAWSEPDAAAYNVRGPLYLVDKKKQPSLPSVFKLLCVDLVKVDAPILTGLCSHPQERIQLALERERCSGVRELPNFIFAVNLCIPGKASYHWVAYFGVDDVSCLANLDTPLGRVAQPFFFGPSDEYRSRTFKLIPRIVQGNVVVRKAVGSQPSILGNKLKQHYIRNERFFEIVVDIGSNKVAQRIVRLAQGYAKALQVDMMFLLEGTDEATLPERILGGVRVTNLDFKLKDGQRLCSPM